MSAQTALVRSEARLALREPVVVFWVVAFPALLMVVLALIPGFRDRDPDLGGLSVLAVYVPVNLALAAAFTGLYTLPTILAGYRERGVLRRLATTPVGPARVLAAQLAVAMAAALAGAVGVLVLAWVVFALPLPEAPVGFAFSYVLVLGAMSAVGLMIAALARSAKVAAMVGNIAFFPLMFLAGLWVPLDVLPDLVQGVAGLTPLGAGSQAMQAALTGAPLGALRLLVLLAWTVVPAAVAVRRFRWQ